MDAAVISSYDAPPSFAEFAEPVPADGEQLVEVRAAAVTNIARSRAAGRHYSSHGELPAVAGLDGVGVLADGRRVYFGAPREPFGTMAQRSLVPAGRAMPVPDELDDVTVAALMNPGVSAWLTLTVRAELRPGERVLVLGATGVTGRLTVQAARLLGAGSVIAAGRNPESLAAVAELGADATVRLDGDLTEVLTDAVGDGVDVIVDYLWGPPTEALLGVLTRGDLAAAARRTRLVQVGTMAGPDITLPGAVLRSTDLVILGAGTGRARPQDIGEAAGRVVAAARSGELRIETEVVPLRAVEDAWSRETGGRRIVLVP